MPERDPSITPRCAYCGSDAVVPDVVPSLGGAYTIKVTVHTNPGAKVMKEPVSTGGSARVCSDCGFIMMFADEPQVVWEAHLDRLAKSTES